MLRRIISIIQLRGSQHFFFLPQYIKNICSLNTDFQTVVTILESQEYTIVSHVIGNSRTLTFHLPFPNICQWLENSLQSRFFWGNRFFFVVYFDVILGSQKCHKYRKLGFEKIHNFYTTAFKNISIFFLYFLTLRLKLSQDHYILFKLQNYQPKLKLYEKCVTKWNEKDVYLQWENFRRW